MYVCIPQTDVLESRTPPRVAGGSLGRWDGLGGGHRNGEFAAMKGEQQQLSEDYPDLDSYVEENLMQGDEVRILVFVIGMSNRQAFHSRGQVCVKWR